MAIMRKRVRTSQVIEEVIAEDAPAKAETGFFCEKKLLPIAMLRVALELKTNPSADMTEIIRKIAKEMKISQKMLESHLREGI